MIFRHFPEQLQSVQNWLTLLMLAALTACGAGASGAKDGTKYDPVGKVSVFTKITNANSAGLCSDYLDIYIDGELKGTINYNAYLYPPECGKFTQSGTLTLNLSVGDHLIYADGGGACVSATETITISSSACLLQEYGLN